MTPQHKITTVDGLAAMTHEEFLAVGNRIGAIEQQVDTGFREMRAGFAAVTEIMNSVLHEVRQIRITDLEKRVAHLERHVGLVK